MKIVYDWKDIDTFIVSVLKGQGFVSNKGLNRVDEFENYLEFEMIHEKLVGEKPTTSAYGKLLVSSTIYDERSSKHYLAFLVGFHLVMKDLTSDNTSGVGLSSEWLRALNGEGANIFCKNVASRS